MTFKKRKTGHLQEITRSQTDSFSRDIQDLECDNSLLIDTPLGLDSDATKSKNSSRGKRNVTFEKNK